MIYDGLVCCGTLWHAMVVEGDCPISALPAVMLREGEM